MTWYHGRNPVVLNGDPPSDLYLASGGSDANDGLTPGTAVVTLSRAYEIVQRSIGPSPLSSVVVLHLADTVNFEPPPFAYHSTGMLVFYGDGAGQAGNDGFTQIAAGTVSANASFLTSFPVTGPLTVDGWVGYTIEITSGAAAGRRRHCVRNTATEVYVGESWGSLVTSGSTFRVLAPRVALHNATSAAILMEYDNFAMVNVALTKAVSAGNLEVSFCNAILYGVIGRSTAQFRGEHSTIIAGAGSLNLQQGISALLDAVGVVDKNLWEGWGLSGLEANAPSFSTPVDVTQAAGSAGITFSGFFIGTPSMDGPAQWYITGGRIDGASLSNGATLYLSQAGAAKYLFHSGLFNIQLIRSAKLIIRTGFVSGARFECENVIKAQSGSYVLIQRNTGTFVMTHSTGIALTAEQSRIDFEGNGLSFVGTGTAGGVLATEGSIVSLVGTNLNYAASSGLAINASVSQITSDANCVVSGKALFDRCTSRLSGSWTLSGADAPLDVRGGEFAQVAGTLSCTASAGAAMRCTRTSRASLRGGANTVLSGTTYGLHCSGASAADFEGALSSVSGTTADLRIDGDDVAASVLAGADDFISGLAAPGSPGNSGGSCISRSA